MRWFTEVVPTLLISYLIFGVALALIGLFLKAWYLIFMLGWNAL